MIICTPSGDIRIINVDDYPTEKAFYEAIWLIKYQIQMPKQDLTKLILDYASNKVFSQ